VNGYPQSFLVMERFGYPDFLTSSADELIDGQYRDRPELRPILDAILARVAAAGEATVQGRKGYISLLTPKRTFAAVQAATKRRVDLRAAPPGPAARRSHRIARRHGFGPGDRSHRTHISRAG